MFEKSCRCGKSKKNFKIDIGPFFVDECCIAAGYDETGKKKVDAADLGLGQNELDQLNSQETQNLEIQDEGEQPDPSENESAEETQEESTEEVDEEEAKIEAEQLAEAEAAEQAEQAPIESETKLEVDGEGSVIQAQAEQAEEPKKKRQYNRSGKVKIDKGSTES